MPLAALAPELIGLGSTIVGGLMGRHNQPSTGGAGPLLPSGLDQGGLLNLINKQTGMGDALSLRGTSTLDRGESTLTGPLNYFSSILSGDRGSLMEALAPEVAAVNAQYQAPLKEASIMGRGSALQPDLEAKRQSDISNLFFQQRPMAADKLTSIAQGLMALGTQQTGMGGQMLQGASRDVLDYNSIIRGIQAQTRNDTPAMFASLGQSLGPLLASILGGIGGKGGGGWGDFNPGFPVIKN